MKAKKDLHLAVKPKKKIRLDSTDLYSPKESTISDEDLKPILKKLLEENKEALKRLATQ